MKPGLNLGEFSIFSSLNTYKEITEKKLVEEFEKHTFK